MAQQPIDSKEIAAVVVNQQQQQQVDLQQRQQQQQQQQQHQQMNMRPMVVMTQQTSTCNVVHPRYTHRAAMACGILQICLGVMCIILDIVYMLSKSFVDIYLGLWTSPFWIVAGAFGVASAVNKKTCTIVTTMVMSIISSVTMLYFLPVGSLEAQGDYAYDDWSAYEDCLSSHSYEYKSCDDKHYHPDGWQARLALMSVMLVIGALEGVVAIIQASLCCRALQCCRDTCCSCCCCLKDDEASNNYTQLTNGESQQVSNQPQASVIVPAQYTFSSNPDMSPPAYTSRDDDALIVA